MVIREEKDLKCKKAKITKHKARFGINQNSLNKNRSNNRGIEFLISDISTLS